MKKLLNYHMKKQHIKLELVEIMVEKQEQYLWCNCLLIHDIEEKKGESTDDLVLQFINWK